jgi:N-acetylglucosamine kinase-like BadF-type ATPase
MRTALAVDGGNSKTDLALLAEDGTVLAHVRDGLSSPHHLGLDGSIALLARMREDAVARAGLDGAPCDVGRLLMAGLDLPAEERTLRDALAPLGWARDLDVGNDTFAVLRAGTEAGWGVAVVCGAGINCVGVAPDGRTSRFHSLGAISGDWGGGYDVGMGALSAAARSQDGRGPLTRLESAVPAHFGLGTPHEVTEAMHLGRIPQRRVIELPPLVFALAAEDAVAAELVDRLAAEIVAMVRVTLGRLGLAHSEVLLGGGMLQRADRRLLDGIAAGLPGQELRAATSPPIVGAALLALDRLGATAEAQERARRELGEAVASVLGSEVHG